MSLTIGPNATPVSAKAATIATITKVVLLWFISHRLSSAILYLNCFTSNAKNIWESVDIFEL